MSPRPETEASASGGAHRARRKVLAVVALILSVLGAAAAAEILFAVAPAFSGARSLHRVVSNVGSFATPEARATTKARLAAATRELDDARRRIARSRALSLFRVVPGLRTQRTGLLDLLDAETTGARSAARLLSTVDSLAESTRRGGGVVPPDGLRALSEEARSASAVAASLGRRSPGLWGPVAAARRRFNRDADQGARRLADASAAVEAARTFLGGEAPRRYLVAIQNNAEMRDQGMVLSYATVRVDHSRTWFERSGSILELGLDRPTDTPVPSGTAEVFGFIDPTRLWQSVNATADFPWSARAMSDMYRQATGQAVDGVIAIDVPALAALLRVLGTVRVSDIDEPLSGENLGRILLHDLYQGLSPEDDAVARRAQLAEVTNVVVERLTNGAGDVVGLGTELGRAAQGGHLRLWSALAHEEQVFERMGLGGGPAVSNRERTFHLAIENRGPSKLDYYVKPAVRQEVSLMPSGDAVVRTTVVLKNEAPPGAAPSYQLGSGLEVGGRPGDYLAWVLLWAPAGSRQAGAVAESGLNLSQAVVLVPAGRELEGTFETTIPNAVRNGRLTLRLVPQQRLTPVDLQIDLVKADGWRIRDGKSWRGPWDRTRTFTWRVSR